MMPISQDRRVSMGLNGDLYFSNVLAKDSHTDYSCNARFLFTHTIQQKNPFTLKVQTSEYLENTQTHTQLRPVNRQQIKLKFFEFSEYQFKNNHMKCIFI